MGEKISLHLHTLTSKQIKHIHDARVREALGGGLTFERTEEEKEFLCERMTGGELAPRGFIDPANAEVYDPRESQRIPKGGAWCMITRKLPGIEGGIDEHIRVGRFFFLEHVAEACQYGFLPNGMYMALCNSPWGTVRLWPYEYSVVPTQSIIEMWQGEELIFHPTNVQLTRFNDIVHYARSRGIGIADAMVMALGTLKGPVGWFEPHADFVEELEAMEERVHRWKPERRSASAIHPSTSPDSGGFEGDGGS